MEQTIGLLALVTHLEAIEHVLVQAVDDPLCERESIVKSRGTHLTFVIVTMKLVPSSCQMSSMLTISLCIMYSTLVVRPV
jgi:hypothetical protein